MTDGFTIKNEHPPGLHVKDGLTFARVTGSGKVVVFLARPTEACPACKGVRNVCYHNSMEVFATELTPDAWASVVAAVSVDGETAETWEQARKFHG